ncbi:Protein trichome birefringence-like [Actinidia chinensis var. chinensis]|uniref:Protein trichome birefringence-like n=1 Tax=Actinidia chinensis var. chinensis TaxID=1590841 RepID=A0A2R6RSZ8_ACTCC|nr:Protein trichome birefringence-like [Actinidia chinensis var. chinensis]
MNLPSNKGDPTVVAYPKTLSTIAASVGGLAIFIVLASLLLVSQPIYPTIHLYFDSIDHSSKFDSLSWENRTINDSRNDGNEELRKFDSQHDGNGIDDSYVKSDPSKSGGSQSVTVAHPDGSGGVMDKNQSSNSDDTSDSSNFQQREETTRDASPVVVSKTKASVDQQGEKDAGNSSFFNVTTNTENVRIPSPGLLNNSNAKQLGLDASSLSPAPISQTGSVDSGCDLYQGKWVHDSSGPLYTNDSCPVLSQMQNCQGNGRPDKDYENWRWKPAKCDLPRFDAKRFLELMRGKTLAFIGDSVARNQMESMLCILWQVEVPKNRGNKRMQRYYFTSTSTMLVRIWSSWLVHQTSDPFVTIPQGVTKLHLDAPDEGFMEFITSFDVVVLSSGHWFAKQSVYILNNEIVGGQLWWPDKSQPMKTNNIEAFGISVETILSALVTHPNYTGLTIVRSFSPDHYEGGAWNTGGSCTGKEKPALDGELVENRFTNIMHEKQVVGFNRAIKKTTNKSKLKLMDITGAFGYRHDGHPGPYRSPDPNKITKRGPDGKPPSQDCLHWCMPGPVDTWNELVLEIIRREFENSHRFHS